MAEASKKAHDSSRLSIFVLSLIHLILQFVVWNVDYLEQSLNCQKSARDCPDAWNRVKAQFLIGKNDLPIGNFRKLNERSDSLSLGFDCGPLDNLSPKVSEGPDTGIFDVEDDSFHKCWSNCFWKVNLWVTIGTFHFVIIVFSLVCGSILTITSMPCLQGGSGHSRNSPESRAANYYFDRKIISRPMWMFFVFGMIWLMIPAVFNFFYYRYDATEKRLETKRSGFLNSGSSTCASCLPDKDDGTSLDLEETVVNLIGKFSSESYSGLDSDLTNTDSIGCNFQSRSPAFGFYLEKCNFILGAIIFLYMIVIKKRIQENERKLKLEKHKEVLFRQWMYNVLLQGAWRTEEIRKDAFTQGIDPDKWGNWKKIESPDYNRLRM